MYLAVFADGRSSYVQVYSRSLLKKLIESLPLIYFVTGDNAYVCTEPLAFTHPLLWIQSLSSKIWCLWLLLITMRIHVEMAVGIFIT